MAKLQNRKPYKDFSVITQTGLKAYQLTEQHAAVKARLKPGTTEDLASDLGQLGVLLPGSQQARSEARSATSAQEKALADGYALVTAVRQVVFRHTTDSDIRRAYGVGIKASPRLVKDVKAAINQIIDRAEA